MTSPQTTATSDPQSTIAALQQRLDAGLAREARLAEELAARTAELLERKSEFDERIEQQSATIDVLKTMSASPGDAQPVFDLIVERARAFCEADGASLAILDGDMMHLRAHVGHRNPAGYAAAFPRPVNSETTMGRAIRSRNAVVITDSLADPSFALQPVFGATSVSNATVPLLRSGVPIGAVAVGRFRVSEFTDAQIELLQTFAEQAVIAITSAETYRALQTRTGDLQETLEYQTATSDVLNVISRSTFDLQPVLDTVAETAAKLCNAEQAAIYQREGGSALLVANCGFPSEYEALARGSGAFPLDLYPQAVVPRAIREGRTVHIHDVAILPGYGESAIGLGKQRTSLGVPLLREGEAIGAIVLARQRVEPFTNRQIELVSTFADQAVIAIENTRLITEQSEALEQQTATAEVLQVINASPGHLAPVFDTMLDNAMHLCGAAFGELVTFDGEHFKHVAVRGVPAAYAEYRRTNPRPPGVPGSIPVRLREGEDCIHVTDLMADEIYQGGNPSRRAMVDLGGARTLCSVALRKNDTLLGYFTIYRQEVRPFSDKQVALLKNFAAQAVIAMENARLINEQREALEQQTATAEVLEVINRSPSNLAPVFDTILEKAMRLCGAAFGSLYTYSGERFHTTAQCGVPPAYAEHRAITPPTARSGSPLERLVETKRAIHILDLAADEGYLRGDAIGRALLDIGGARTALMVPLLKDESVVGAIVIYRQEVQAFSQKQIALVENFAAQAVIAIENARLLDEIRQRQEELRVTFENMGDGVAMFDETQHLVAWNRKFQDILDVPDDIIARRRTFSEYVHYLAGRGEYDPGGDPEEHVRGLIEQAGQSRTYERTRPDGRVIEIRHNPVPSGGFVLIYADITERKRSEAEIRAARDAAEEASRTIEAAYRDLKTAQANLIQAEKMASLGQLTAGIAHEIKNPLNFVNNFAALSVDLLSELKETAAPGFAVLSEKQRAEVEEVSVMLTSNLEKITEHGKRADGIVKAMLEHSRGSSGERRMVDLNALIDEALNLAYHGARAQDQSFNITLDRDFGAGIAPIDVNPQDITRMFLNIFSNGFYATTRRARDGRDAGFEPTLKVITRDAGEAVEIRVRDNGTGIPADIRDKLFQPFFTTKPTGEGTGLGLSITYDIITQQHGGNIAVDSKVGEYSEFTIQLPRNP